MIKEAQDMLPELRQEYEEVTRLLAQEQADIDEIENSDKDFLNELKATIAEQRYLLWVSGPDMRVLTTSV